MGTALSALHEGPTNEACAQCEEDLIYTEDVFTIHVMRALIVNGLPVLQPLLDDDGDFLYQPYFLHFKCWEEIVDNHKEEIENTPPVEDEFSLLTCDCCGSDIREHEVLMAATLGELVLSERSPSGQRATRLEPSGSPDVFCIWCLSMINNDWIEFWEDGVGIEGESLACLECQGTRCWRGFDCACTCHDDDLDNLLEEDPNG